MIAVLDYGGGNVGSVLKAIEYLGQSGRKGGSACGAARGGQNHFPGARPLRRHDEGTRGAQTSYRRCSEALAEGKPFFGICLGLQALYEASEEAPGVVGLGLLPGSVTRFQGVFKVPHVGWSQLVLHPGSGLFRGVADGSFVYYCHSYYGPVRPEACAITEYGQSFAAGIEMKQIWAVQFHPEKSGEVGLKVLSNFLNL